MTTENLLPCPFCGTQPEWINEAIPDAHYYIRCPNCHITMKEDRRDKVIGFWNNRPQNSHIHSVMQTLPFSFVEWYSGMQKEKIESAYKRWMKEGNVSVASEGEEKGECAGCGVEIRIQDLYCERCYEEAMAQEP